MNIVPNSVDEFLLEDFFYNLFDGGYISPMDVCEDHADAECVMEAVQIIKDFRDSLEASLEANES